MPETLKPPVDLGRVDRLVRLPFVLDAAIPSEDGHCPKCGWDHENGNRTESMPVLKNVVADYEFGYCGGQHWDEVWACEECGTAFEFSNGSV